MEQTAKRCDGIVVHMLLREYTYKNNSFVLHGMETNSVYFVELHLKIT